MVKLFILFIFILCVLVAAIIITSKIAENRLALEKNILDNDLKGDDNMKEFFRTLGIIFVFILALIITLMWQVSILD